MHVGKRRPVVPGGDRVLNRHHALVALFTGHQFLDHCAVTLIHGALVWVAAVDRTQTLVADASNVVSVLIVAQGGWLGWELWQLEAFRGAVAAGLVIVLNTTVGKDGVVEVEPGLRRHAFSLFLVVVHAVYVDYALVVTVLAKAT